MFEYLHAFNDGLIKVLPLSLQGTEFGVPGEGITAATIVDGHPMPKTGEAGRALDAALMSSLVGAVFGAFMLALAIPIVAPLVLSIGSAEFFMLALLGITFVGLSAARTFLKGWWLAAWALCSRWSASTRLKTCRVLLSNAFWATTTRCFFDSISLIAVTVGLFAIPEIIDLAVKGTSIAGDKAPTKLGGVMEGVKGTFRQVDVVNLSQKHFGLTMLGHCGGTRINAGKPTVAFQSGVKLYCTS